MDEPSQPTSEKRFYSKDYSIGNTDRVSNKNSQGGSGGVYTYERSNCTTCGKQLLVGVLLERMFVIDVVIRVIR